MTSISVKWLFLRIYPGFIFGVYVYSELTNNRVDQLAYKQTIDTITESSTYGQMGGTQTNLPVLEELEIGHTLEEQNN